MSLKEKVYEHIIHCNMTHCLNDLGKYVYIYSYLTVSLLPIYTMQLLHNKLSNFLCFASFCAHLCTISNTFNCNDENWILGK